MNHRQRSTLAPTAPERLGRYQVLGHLATGGMAEILLARLEGPAGFQKVVVLKRVLPHLARKSEFRRMFVDEARIVASLRHPNVVQVSELGRDGDELFLVMEYLEGESLARVLRKVSGEAEPRGLDFALCAHIVAAACAGLHAAHEYVADGVPQNLVHRDVSPQNLFVTYDGAVKVLDFGVAKAVDRYTNTSTGQVKGKFAYMAPEQCLAEEIDRRTDVFALGIVLWEISTGRRLFARENELLVFKAICEQPVKPPSEVVPGYPPALEAIVLRALARNREDRYATAAEMRRELQVVARDLAPAAIPEDELASSMRELFAERIAQKAELSRRVGDGVNVGTLEWLEGDTDGQGFAVDTADLDSSGTRSSARVEPEPAAAPVEPRSSRLPLVLGGALALAAAIGLGVTLALVPSGDEPAAPEPRAGTEPAPAAAPATAPIAEPPPPAPAATVSVDLDSTPSGARVRIGGEERGHTPITLALPRGEEQLELTFDLEGYDPITESITPDVDQRVRVLLVRAPAAPRARRPARPAPAPTKRSGGFYRFD